jgi:tRNA A37 threonylcarbamoyladenosine synthetase subunit TsaC/SUA5/YrdC
LPIPVENSPMILTIHTAHPEPRAIHKAAEILAAGGIVIYPTDTVYGLGCSVENKNAIERIHLIKRRGPTSRSVRLFRPHEHQQLCASAMPRSRL